MLFVLQVILVIILGGIKLLELLDRCRDWVVERGLALPDEVLQKLYHDNAANLLAKVGVSFEG